MKCSKVHLPFVCNGNARTLDDRGCERLWVRQPKAGLEKRQATVHLTLCAGRDAIQPKPIVIFRGNGKNIMQSDERSKWVTTKS